MAELATLGLSVTSEPVVKATTALNEMAGAAQKTERAAESLGASSERSAKRIAGLTGVQEKVIASLERLEKTMDRMAAEQKELSGYAAASAASLERLATAGAKVQSTLGTAGTGAASFNKSVQAVNDNSRLASHQLLNLSRQGNDVITMFALGAPPMQIFASQAGQIYDALASGEGGLKGGLNQAKNSLKDFLSGFSRAGLILGGVAGAAVAAGAAFLYFTDKTEANFKKLEGAAKSYKDTIAEVTRGQKELAAAADAVFSRSTTPTGAGAAARIQAELETQRRAIAAAREQAPVTAFAGLSVFRPDITLRDAARRARGQTSAKDLIDRAQDFESGAASVEKFRLELDKVGADGNLPAYLRDIYDGLVTIADGARDAEGHIKALTDATLQLKSDRFAEFGKQLREFIPDTKSARDRINELAEAQSNQARSTGQALQVEKDRQAALGELDRKEANRRAGYELDVRAITARTAAEKAAIAAERARLELANDPELKGNSAEIERRAQEASNLSLKQSQFDLAEAMRQRVEAGQSQVEQAQMEIDLVGKSVGETARLRVEYDLMTAAKQAAKEAGELVDPSEVEAIKAQAAAIGEATEALDKLNFQRDVAFRLAQAGRSEQDQRIAAELNSSGIDFDSAEGQRRAGMLRYVEAVEKAGDATRDLNKATKDAFADMADAIGSGESAFDSFISAFSQLGQKMASAGFDNLLNPVQQSASTLATKIGTVAASTPSVSPLAFTGSSSSSAKLRIDTGDLASASGQIMQYSSRFNSSVDKRLLTILNTAASRFDMPVKAISGLRPGDSRYHGKGMATDVQIYGSNGQALGNYQDASTFRTYERFAQLSKQVQAELFPELEGMLRWGGYFGGSKGKYGALDTMHFDLAGNRVGMGGGSWENGLTAAQRSRWPGAQSQGITSRQVSEGVVDAQRRIASGAVPIPTARPTASEGGVSINTGGGGFSNSLKGFMNSTAGQGLFTGLGAAAQGYSSGSPLGGAFSGLMGGLATGNPIRAGIGAIAGLVGGIFGKSKQKKEAQKQKWAQAEEAWQQNLPAFRKLEDEVTRTERGPLSSKISEMQETLKQFDDLAKKGKGDRNNDQIRRVRAEMADYIAFLSDNFIRDLPQVIGDLGKGSGLDTSFTKARDSVMAQADSYRGFLKDITDAYAVPTEQKDGILAQYAKAKADAAAITKSVTNYTTDNRGNVYRKTGTEVVRGADPAALAAAGDKRDAALAEYEAKYADAIRKRDEALAAATKAAQEGLLRIVSGDIPEQTDIEKAIEEARGAASGLRTALVDLGMSAEETAVAIDKALGQRIAKMRGDFEDAIRSDINDLDGKGYLNSVKDLLKTRDTMMADAGRLGADTTLVASYFKKSAQEIVDGAELSGDAFADLIKVFPDLTDVISAFAESAKDLAQTNLDTARSDLDRSYNAEVDTINKLVSARQDQISTLNDTISGLESYFDQLDAFRKNVLVNNLSTLSPEDKLAEARRQFEETAAKAKAGDEDARGNLTSFASEYLNQAKDFFASGQGYVDAFDAVKSLVDEQSASSSKALTDAKAQLTALESQNDLAEKQLEVLKNQYDAILGTNDGIKSMADALAAYAAAMTAARDAGISVGGTATNPQYQDETLRFVETQFKALLGRSADMGALDFFSAMRSKGATADEIIASIKQSSEYKGGKLFGGLVGRYQEGGIVGNGLWNKDSVLARYAGGGMIGLAGGEFVVPAPMVNPRTLPALEAIRQGAMTPANSNGSDGTQAEIRALRAEVVRLGRIIADGAMANVAATREGVAAQQSMANAQKRVSAA